MVDDFFIRFVEEAEKYCGRIGLGKEFFLELFGETSDWSFIIKLDALHETACRDLAERTLMLRAGAGEPGELADFVSDMGFQGRTSILKIVAASGCPKDFMQFLEGVRQIRNAFAHDVRSINRSLLETIGERKNREQLLKNLSNIEDAGYDEQEFVETVKGDPGVLRFAMLIRSMRLLYEMHFDFKGEH